LLDVYIAARDTVFANLPLQINDFCSRFLPLLNSAVPEPGIVLLLGMFTFLMVAGRRLASHMRANSGIHRKR